MPRFLTTFALLVLFLLATGVTLLAQADGAGGAPAEPRAVSVSPSASKEEVQELRNEVAAQQQTIEELKAMVQQLANQQGAGDAHVVNAAIVQPQPTDGEDPLDVAEQSATKSGQPPLTSGWNGEHFFIRSPDGQFSISPYGYVDTDYRAYKGDGAPPDTFLVRRARFGFQGNFGSHFDFALLTDANSTSGAIVRDVYLNVRIRPEFQIQAGQFKEPFAQETGIGATNLDFVERGLQALLYPSTGTAFRSPGITIHGDIDGSVVQYWLGAFNGRNGVTPNATNEPEFVGRLRFYPWRKSKNGWFKQFAFGGSASHSRSRGLSGDLSFSGQLPDGTYSFFPQLPINGPIERYEGEFTYIRNAYALRGEYVQMQQQRDSTGSLYVGGLGFITLPGIGAKAWNIGTTYLLTGEKRPENGTPRVRHPLFGPDTPGGAGRGWGAFEATVRYSGIQANAPATNLLNLYTPGFVSAYDYHTDQFAFGINWYPNYWVKYQFNVNIDRLKQPSTIGQLPQNFTVLMQELQFRF
ncbi:MAG: porin [Terriglobales bacterium]